MRARCWLIVPLLSTASCVIVLHKGKSADSDAGVAPDAQTMQPDAADADVDASDNPSMRDAQPEDAHTQEASTPSGKWENVTGNLANMNVGCGNLMMVAAAPDTDLVFVGLAGHGVWSFGGSDWSMMNRGSGAEMLDGNATKAVFAPDDPQHFWVTTIYGARGVYETFDRGDTFHAAKDVSHLDELAINLEGDKFSPWVAGGHESDHKLWMSTDQGKSWMDIGTALPDGKACTHPVVLDADTFLVGCSYNAEGIYRSENHGGAWKQVSDHGGNASALVLSNGNILWATSSGGLLSSSDRGSSWSEVSPAGTFKGIGVGPIALPDDRIAALGSGGVIVSGDAGKSWKTVSPALPYADATGFAYSKSQAAFFVKHNTCEDPVPKDAVMRFAWDSGAAR